MLPIILESIRTNRPCFSSAIFPKVPKFILLFVLINSHICLCQNKSHDAVAYLTIVKTAGKDINKAMQMADSLYKVSDEPLDKVKSLMLLADLNQTTGKKREALNYAFKAEQITSDNDLYEWQARIYGFIASHYRSIGLKKQSRLYLTKGLETINKVKDAHIVNQYKGLAYQELALYEIENEEYEKAINYLNTAEPYFKYIRDNELRLYQFATNHGQLGRAYMNLKDTDKAVSHFNEALDFLSQIKNEATVVKGYMYEGIGRAFLENNDLKEAIVYLEKAFKIASDSNDMVLEMETYCDLAIYYLEIDDKAQYKHYNNLYLEAIKNSEKVNEDSSEAVVNRLEKRETELSFKHNLILSGFSILLFFFLVILWINRSKRKKEYKRFQEIIKNIKEQPKHLKIINEPEISSEKINTGDNPEKELMSKEVEQSILDKLMIFEQGDAFISKSINLSGLSVLLETNSKYLSYVINKHKKKDFNSYINELRIFYIIKKLESSPEYLNYKISYLADECGFSSHSKFTDKFKTVTGISPSSFIQFLDKRSKEKVA